MKISYCSRLLGQILKLIQTTEKTNDLVQLTQHFNRLIKGIKIHENEPCEQLRELKQVKVYLEYTKKKTAQISLQCHYDLLIALVEIEIEMCAFYFSFEDVKQERDRPIKRSNLQWTDQLSDLVEFAYGIVAKKSVNDGKALLKNVIRALEDAFNVNLSNYTHIFYAIRNRKGDRAVFLKELHDALNAKMDDMDK